MKIVAASLLDDYLEHGAFAVDLRSPEEYAKLHVKGAVNIPEEEMEKQMMYLPQNRLIVLYCQRGTSSIAVGRRLSHAGFRVVSVNGGISAYHGKYLEKGQQFLDNYTGKQ